MRMKISKPSANQIMNTDKHSSTQRKIWTYPFKSLFLAIQLSGELGFGLETPIFLTIQLLKPFIFSSLVALIGGFVYMDDTCSGTHISGTLSFFCPLLFFFSSSLFRSWPSTPILAMARPALPSAKGGCSWLRPVPP